MLMESSLRAMAAVRNPNPLRLLTGLSSHVHGTRNTDPIDTRTARRFSGSHELLVSSTASMPKAAAERKMAPMLVVSVTPSITTTHGTEHTPRQRVTRQLSKQTSFTRINGNVAASGYDTFRVTLYVASFA